MPQKVTESAQISCSQGTQPSRLVVSSQNFSFIDGKLIATEEDKTNQNIPSFGQCKIKGNLPCIPAPVGWQKTAEKDKILNSRMLTDFSFCMCSAGGKIKIDHKGYNEKHSIE